MEDYENEEEIEEEPLEEEDPFEVSPIDITEIEQPPVEEEVEEEKSDAPIAIRTCTVNLDGVTVELVEGQPIEGLTSQELAHLKFHGFVV